MTNRGGAAIRWPLPRSRAGRVSLIAGAAALVIVASALIYREAAAPAEPARPVSKAQYELALQAVYADVQNAFRATNVAPSLLAARVAAAQKELRRAAQRLEALQPPRAVRGENLVIAAALEEYAADLESVRLAAASGNAQRIAEFSANISNNLAIRKIAEAAEEMRLKGYDVGRIGRD